MLSANRYWTDIYLRGRYMTYRERLELYEKYKKEIAKQNLPPHEYERRIKKLARRLNI